MEKIYKKQAISKSKEIEQYDLDNNYIKTWVSASKAARELNINSQIISSCCNKKTKTYKNYIWKFINDNDLPNEIWINLDNDLKNVYISNMGRYYTKYTNKKFGTNLNNNMILNYGKKIYQIARLVLIGFVGEPPSDNHIAHHIDSISINNKLENLQWKLKNDIIRLNNNILLKNNLRKIIQLKDGNIINKYDSIIEASKKSNINRGNISACINDKNKTAGGFNWQIIDDDLIDEIWKKNNNLKIFVSNKGRYLSTRGKTYGHFDNKSKYYKYGNKLVHRLIAETFIDNLDNKKTVDHIDGDTTNNCIENLRWATMKEQVANRGHN